MKFKLILLAILLLGLSVRVYNLTGEGLWLDEGLSIRTAQVSPFQIIKERASDVHPPLYYIILHYWINLFGDSEFSTRLLSVIFGFLALYMIYKLGTLIFDKDVGILSCSLLALSVFHVIYSQEVRMYALATLLTLLSMYFFIRLLKKINFTTLIGYILSTIFLIYTHYSGLCILAAQNIYFLIISIFLKDSRPNFKKWLIIQAVLVGLYSPWISIAISQIIRIQSGYWWPIPTIFTLITIFCIYSGSPGLLFPFLMLSFLSMLTYKEIKGSINWKAFLDSVESYRWNMALPDAGMIYLLLIWLLTPVMLPFIISRFSTPICHPRYTIVASLAFYLLVSKGIRNLNHKYIRLAVVFAIIPIFLANIWDDYTVIDKEQWREVANYIEANAQPGDLLLFNSGGCQYKIFDYYSKRTDLLKRPFPKDTDFVDEENIKELGPTVERHHTVWLILSHSPDKDGLIARTLSDSYNLLQHKKYYGIVVYLFRRE